MLNLFAQITQISAILLSPKFMHCSLIWYVIRKGTKICVGPFERSLQLAIQLMLTENFIMMNLFPLVKNCTVAMTIGSDIIGYKFNNKGNKPVPGSDSIIESFSCDPLALKSGHIFINIIAYKSQLYHNWLLESLGKWKVGSNDVKSGEWWRKRVKVVVRWVVREWWQQIAMLTQPTTSAMNLVILSPGCVLVIKRSCSMMLARSFSFVQEKWKFWSWPIPLCAQAGPDGLPARLSVEWSAHNWNWATTNPREWNPRWTRWHRHHFRAYFSTSVCLFKLPLALPPALFESQWKWAGFR